MPAHRDFIAAFHGALDGGRLPPGLTDSPEMQRRFAVYRNNVAASLTEALARRFPVIRRLVGEAFFAPLARSFIGAHPPASPVLLEWGEAFPAFLAAFPPLARYPYMADVARIEMARGRAYHAADAAPLAAAALAGADPDRLHLRLHPSVQVLHLPTPAVSIWQLNQPGATPAPLPATAEIALILRDRGLEVPVRAIGPGGAALLAALAAGASLTAAAGAALDQEPAFDPAALLPGLIRAGAFVLPQGAL